MDRKAGSIYIFCHDMASIYFNDIDRAGFSSYMFIPKNDWFFSRYTGHGPDLDTALASCDQSKPVILLAHQPKAAKMALNSQYRVDLVLSGENIS